MRFKMLAATLLVLLPAPALADVTVHYVAKDKPITIEVEDGGNARLDLAGKFTVIRREGVDYVVAQDAAGASRVARVDDLLAMLRAQMKEAGAPSADASGMTLALIQRGSETLAGYPGIVWSIGPAAAGSAGAQAGARSDMVDVVISTDPRLAPAGGFLKHLIDSVGTNMIPGVGSTAILQRVDELLAKGAPTRVGPFLTLVSVETGEIADSRFALPGPVLSAAEFFEALDPAKAAQALPPAP